MDDRDFRDAYAAPGGELRRPRGADPPAGSPDLALLAAWERRRLRYNGVLAVVVLLAVGLGHAGALLDPAFWELLVGGAFGANVCFCTGPVAEAYARWLGVRGESIGPILFAVGLALSIPLTLLVVGGFMLTQMGV